MHKSSVINFVNRISEYHCRSVCRFDVASLLHFLLFWFAVHAMGAHSLDRSEAVAGWLLLRADRRSLSKFGRTLGHRQRGLAVVSRG